MTREVAPALVCGEAWAARTEDGSYEAETEPGTYRCHLSGLWLDPATPAGTDRSGGHPVEGTLVVRSGEQTVVDLAVDLTP